MLSYGEARELCKTRGIVTESQYRRFHGKLAMPLDPQKEYGEQWRGWNSFLIGRRNDPNWRKKGARKPFPTYAEAKEILRDTGIKGIKGYTANYKRLGLPSNPDKEWKNKGFLGMKDLLEFSGAKVKNRYVTYDKCKSMVWRNNIYTAAQYDEFQSTRPKVPSDPAKTYAGAGWGGWDAFLKPSTKLRMKKCIRRHNKRFVSYDKAVKIVRALGIRDMRAFFALSHVTSRFYIYSHPEKYYREWKGWNKFLGTKEAKWRKQKRNKRMRSIVKRSVIKLQAA